MSSHDEYSSDEESINEVSNVQLGFVDIPIDEEEQPTIEDTILGGQPIWLHPNSLPDEKLVTCNNCGSKMALYLQAFSPFEDELYDRVIYIFGCLNTKTCLFKNGSIKCIRGISKDPVKIDQLKKEQQDQLKKELDEKLKLEAKNKLRDELTKDLFSSGKAENPFGNNPFSGANPFGNPFDKKESADNVKVEEANQVTKDDKPTYASITASNIPPPTKKTPNNYELPSYPGYFVFVEKEKFKKVTIDAELEKYKDLIDTNSIEEEEIPSSSSSKANVNPQTEKISGMLDDKVFENFSTTVQHNPTQILRFNLGGKPLLYNGKDKLCKSFSSEPFNIPVPAFNPSSVRQFELQLMPKSIIDLEKDEVNIMDGMSWGTIIVCTDVEDFMPLEYFDDNHVAYIEEYCGVQWEESV